MSAAARYRHVSSTTTRKIQPAQRAAWSLYMWQRALDHVRWLHYR